MPTEPRSDRYPARLRRRRTARRSAAASLLGLSVVAATLVTGGTAGATPRNANPFCARLGKTIEASAGAQMFCFGPQPNQGVAASGAQKASATAFGRNVDAANPREDRTAAGVQAYGQSETSVAANGSYVVEAWNDATFFFAPCPSPESKQSATGYGFSSNGGASFVDQGGLPAPDCNYRLEGDPSVETWTSGGTVYFYISSLYDRFDGTGRSRIALNVCKVTGTGAGARLSCGSPVTVAVSTQCQKFGPGLVFCSFLDKEYLSIDPRRGRLYLSYTEFRFDGTTPINLSACDLGTTAGGSGPAGGRAGRPVCEHGSTGTTYLTVSAGDSNCEQEGSYPAVDVPTGDLYVAFEYNQGTNIFFPPCQAIPTRQVVNRIPGACLTLSVAAGCGGPAKTNSVRVISMAAAFIPGYNRFPMNDFPRIAVDDHAGTVSIVWNDARANPLGDIYLQSFQLGSLARIQGSPVRISGGGSNFLPGMRRAAADGSLPVSWYSRDSANTTITGVRAALNLSPRATSAPASVLVTSQPTDWNAVSSDIVPNFGDYTDNYVVATATAPYVGQRDVVAWSDGRLGLPQPFEASALAP